MLGSCQRVKSAVSPHQKSLLYCAARGSFNIKKRKRTKRAIFSRMLQREVHYMEYEEAVSSQKSLTANINAYIMRNQEMIDHSDICVFYYNKGYLPLKSKPASKCLSDHQPKSGTAISFTYAAQKRRKS